MAYPPHLLSGANTRYEVLCSIAILLDKPQPIYTYTDAKYAIRKEGKPAGNAGSAGSAGRIAKRRDNIGGARQRRPQKGRRRGQGRRRRRKGVPWGQWGRG
jgi:hypothetical protein